jgi:hypothetical protein
MIFYLLKPQELFLCDLVDPVTEGFFRFASLPLSLVIVHIIAAIGMSLIEK